MSWMLTNYGVDFEIDTTPFGTASTWASLCEGITNYAEALNEQVHEFFGMCMKGYGADEVIAIHPSYTLSGDRIVGSAAQDYIVGTQYNVMNGRHTNARMSRMNADGTITRYTFKATLKGITTGGGNMTDPGQFAVTISMYGRPTTETVAASGELTVTSVAGTASGTTVLTAAPTFPDAGCKFVYAYGDTAPVATAGSVLTGWNDFVNGATYQIANGKKVTVAMVNVSTFVVVGSGNATVVSAT